MQESDHGRYIIARQSDNHVRVYSNDRVQAVDIARANHAHGVAVTVYDTQEGRYITPC